MQIDPLDFRRNFDLNGEYSGKLEIDEKGDGLAEELVASGENPNTLGVGWRKEIGEETGKLEKICKNEQQLGQSNGFDGFEAAGRLPVRSLVDEEAVRDALGIGKVRELDRARCDNG